MCKWCTRKPVDAEPPLVSWMLLFYRWLPLLRRARPSSRCIGHSGKGFVRPTLKAKSSVLGGAVGPSTLRDRNPICEGCSKQGKCFLCQAESAQRFGSASHPTLVFESTGFIMPWTVMGQVLPGVLLPFALQRHILLLQKWCWRQKATFFPSLTTF